MTFWLGAVKLSARRVRGCTRDELQQRQKFSREEYIVELEPFHQLIM